MIVVLMQFMVSLSFGEHVVLRGECKLSLQVINNWCPIQVGADTMTVFVAQRSEVVEVGDVAQKVQ